MPLFDQIHPAIYYEDSGQGEPVVFITGLGGNHGNWRPYVQRLQKDFRCITLDNRGTGQSGRPTEPYTISDMAQDVVRVFDYLNIQDAHVIGNSLGGRIAQQIADSNPRRIKSLVLMSTTASVSPWYDSILQSWERMRRYMPLEEYYRSVATWLCGPSTHRHRGYIDGFVKYSIENDTQSLEDFLLQVQAIRTQQANLPLQEMDMPCLLICGREDLPLLPDMIEMSKQIPSANLHIIEQTGHMAAFEKFTEVWPIVHKFLTEHSAPGNSWLSSQIQL
ncbi:alpha/beta hydrolase [Fodinisporobacter ferrooxydans]|uniref:Alpha/beta hydrolase n=1 Tax=Fodinisporobacter ferrooxydans TaxID=2901836 RepID=A0ABY4CFZ9_9BACL|nr:alpha/beta hydrolase [Alicyclobacillaceae bacterium MYW30-H2]